jgi:hypothetical protein
MPLPIIEPDTKSTASKRPILLVVRFCKMSLCYSKSAVLFKFDFLRLYKK